jgi:hypothetical protein
VNAPSAITIAKAIRARFMGAPLGKKFETQVGIMRTNLGAIIHKKTWILQN